MQTIPDQTEIVALQARLYAFNDVLRLLMQELGCLSPSADVDGTPEWNIAHGLQLAVQIVEEQWDDTNELLSSEWASSETAVS